MTCWRRLRDWQEAGVWRQLHQVLLADLNEADKIDWSRAVVDSAMLRAMSGGPKTGPNPTDRRKPGSKHRALTDGNGIPLVMILTAANVHDVKELIPLVDAIPPVRGKRGRPRRKPDRVQADTAYDSDPHRKELRKRGILPVIPKRGREHGSGLGTFRWVVERTLSWLHQFRRLRIRWERRDDIHEGFVELAESLIIGDGEALVDGGLVNNIPADVLVGKGCNFVLASSVTAKLEREFVGIRPDQFTLKHGSPSFLKVLLRGHLVQSFNMNAVGVQPADFVIEPDVTAFDLSEFERTDEMAAIGEQTSVESLAQIRQLLSKLDPHLFPAT